MLADDTFSDILRPLTSLLSIVSKINSGLASKKTVGGLQIAIVHTMFYA